jgi:hypothetical protein
MRVKKTKMYRKEYSFRGLQGAGVDVVSIVGFVSV